MTVDRHRHRRDRRMFIAFCLVCGMLVGVLLGAAIIAAIRVGG